MINAFIYLKDVAFRYVLCLLVVDIENVAMKTLFRDFFEGF